MKRFGAPPIKNTNGAPQDEPAHDSSLRYETWPGQQSRPANSHYFGTYEKVFCRQAVPKDLFHFARTLRRSDG
jgi:hypothetical protein